MAAADTAAPGRPDGDPAPEPVIPRVIKASPQRCSDVWTTRLKEWWGPHGMTMPCVEMKPRPDAVHRAGAA